jgi:putative chitinase
MLLKVGSQGDDVVKLQIKLGVDPIGKFGPKTEAAVKGWQSAHGLTPDGIVGDGTWARMFAPVAQSPVPFTISGTSTSTYVVPAPIIEATSAFKLDRLKGHIPQAVIDQIPDTASKFGITNNLRLAHFLAQCGHESGGFRAVSENLNYSAKGLLGIFRKYFTNVNLAMQYERKPEKIANRVYALRMGNGAEASGDGYKYRGRGYIQLTGKDNYSLFDATVPESIIAQPDLVATKYPLASAAFFFKRNNLWAICDRGATPDVVTAVTKRVNGGTIGLADRQKHFKEYYNLLA